MVRYRSVVSEVRPDEDFPLRALDVDIDMKLDFGEVDVPEAARRKMALDALRRIVSTLESRDLSGGRPVPQIRREAPSDEVVEYVDPDAWVRPAGIDMRVVKSAHKVVQEISKRGENGRAVLASELVQDGLISAPTMSRLLRDDELAGQYLAPYLIVSAAGRTKALDLTPKGRLLASKIRAGVIPS